MEAAGYHFDELESTDGNLRFLPDGIHEIGGVMISDSWNDVKEWLEGVRIYRPALPVPWKQAVGWQARWRCALFSFSCTRKIGRAHV